MHDYALVRLIRNVEDMLVQCDFVWQFEMLFSLHVFLGVRLSVCVF
jgi:hypothetical protein